MNKPKNLNYSVEKSHSVEPCCSLSYTLYLSFSLTVLRLFFFLSIFLFSWADVTHFCTIRQPLMLWISWSISHDKLHWTWSTPVCVDTACAILIHVQEQLIITGHSFTITSNVEIGMVQHEWLSQSKLGSLVHFRMASFWINYHMWRAVSHCDLPTAAPCYSNTPDTPDPRARWPGSWVDLPARSLQTPLGGMGRWTHETTNTENMKFKYLYCIQYIR